MKPNYLTIQKEAITRYRIDICDGSRCPDGDKSRMHAHPKIRRICKLSPKDSIESTFSLFHEIGHIESGKSSTRRAEDEWHATCWAIDRFKELGLDIPAKIIFRYQQYILLEVSRGIRRGGKGYPKMNLYEYVGNETPVEIQSIAMEDRWWCIPEALDVL